MLDHRAYVLAGYQRNEIAAVLRTCIKAAAGEHAVEQERVADRDRGLDRQPLRELEVGLVVRGVAGGCLVEELQHAVALVRIDKGHADHRLRHEMGLLVDRLVMVLEIVLDDRQAAREHGAGLALADRNAQVLHLAGGGPGGGREIELVLPGIVQDHRAGLRSGHLLADRQDMSEHIVERQRGRQPVDRVEERPQLRGIKLGPCVRGIIHRDRLDPATLSRGLPGCQAWAEIAVNSGPRRGGLGEPSRRGRQSRGSTGCRRMIGL